MTLVTVEDQSGTEKYRERLRISRDRIEKLEEKDEPKYVEIGRMKVRVWEDVPDFRREVYACMRKYWPGTRTPQAVYTSDERSDSTGSDDEENEEEN